MRWIGPRGRARPFVPGVGPPRSGAALPRSCFGHPPPRHAPPNRLELVRAQGLLGRGGLGQNQSVLGAGPRRPVPPRPVPPRCVRQARGRDSRRAGRNPLPKPPPRSALPGPPPPTPLTPTPLFPKPPARRTPAPLPVPRPATAAGPPCLRLFAPVAMVDSPWVRTRFAEESQWVQIRFPRAKRKAWSNILGQASLPPSVVLRVNCTLQLRAVCRSRAADDVVRHIAPTCLRGTRIAMDNIHVPAWVVLHKAMLQLRALPAAFQARE